MEEETFFDRFWEASKLDKFNSKEFAKRFNNYSSNDKKLSLEYPVRSLKLPMAKSPINKVAQVRKSERSFSGRTMSTKELSLVMSSFFAWNGIEHRSYPSAGATYTTEVFCVAFDVKDYSGQVLYYDSVEHGLVQLPKRAPSWEEAQDYASIKTAGSPSAIIVFVSFPNRATAKYGERGGRFSMLEAGAAMQQLALNIASSKNMSGVAVGGMHDEYWKRVLGLEQTEAMVVLGYLVGHSK